MPKKKTIGMIIGAAIGTTAVAAHVMKKKAESTSYKAEMIDAIPVRKMGFYEKYRFKRLYTAGYKVRE